VTDRLVACGLFAGLLLVYNSNGREIGSTDSQPTKYAARELLLRGTLTLNHVVGATPQLTERPAFAITRQGSYRSAYSPVPAIAAAAIAWPIWKLRLVDLRAPRGANVVAVTGASVLTALAVVCAFFTARRFMPSGRAAALALALGLGTGYWCTVSRTLWQHETAIFGLSLAVLMFTAPELRTVRLWLGGVGLSLAGTSRPQLAPIVAALLVCVLLRAGWRRAAPAVAITAASVLTLAGFNMHWFGSPIGGLAILEAMHPAIHATERSFDPAAGGYLGLLVSPSRGLLIFSPIVVAALSAIRAPRTGGIHTTVQWCAIAALAQFLLYGTYAVWWGGHTYGPRYMLDLLPLLVPLAAAGLNAAPVPVGIGALGAAALAWSIAVAATGAFVYPHDRWNTDPVSVDRHHERLWDWSDPQIVRCWKAGPSPVNFTLFERR
jgi:hypothetical protein